MNIFKQELKKIFQIKIVLFAAVIAVLLSLPMLWHFFDMERFGPYDKEMLLFVEEINEKYGPTISADEIQEMRKCMEDKSLVEKASFYRMAVRSWDILQDELKSYPTPESNPWIDDTIDGEIYAKCMYESGETYYNWFGPDIIAATSKFFCNTAIILAVVLFILIAPLSVRDKMMGVYQQQFPSKTGRSIYVKQYLAVMVTAFVVITIGFLLMGGLFLRHGTWKLWDNNIYSFFDGLAVPIKYGTWWLLLIALGYMLLMGLAGFIFFVSCHSKNYVDMLVKCIPTAIVGIVLISFTMDGFISGENQIVAIFKTLASVWFSIPVGAAVCVIGIALGTITCLKGKKAEN